MTTRSHISILPLERWLKYYTNNKYGIKERLSTGRYHVIPPVFNRDGYYWNRITDSSWYECNGQAFSVPSSEMFRYEPSLLNAKQLSSREVLAYREMLKLSVPKLLKKQVCKILAMDYEAKQLRNIRFNYLRSPHF